jgi:hypothetical protein
MDNSKKLIFKLGEVSFDDNKVRIHFETATESVLFEDIASISYKQVAAGNPKVLMAGMSLAALIFFLGLLLGNTLQLFLFAVSVVFLTIVLTFTIFKMIWDEVEIESKGGKIISYSVVKGKGRASMELIETKKREITGK